MKSLLTTKEVAQILKKKPGTVAGWRRSNMGPPYVNLNGTIRYDEDLLRQWLNFMATREEDRRKTK